MFLNHQKPLNTCFENFENPKAPLYFLSDEEIELYAKLASIKGKKRKKHDKIWKLFSQFKEKNPDLEHNIVNSCRQLKQSSQKPSQ